MNCSCQACSLVAANVQICGFRVLLRRVPGNLYEIKYWDGNPTVSDEIKKNLMDFILVAYQNKLGIQQKWHEDREHFHMTVERPEKTCYVICFHAKASNNNGMACP